MKCKLKFILLILFLAITILGKTQNNLAFYPIEDQFNSSVFNPAFLASQKNFSFSLFPIGGTIIGYNNQDAIKQLVSKLISGISTDNDYKQVLTSMADRSWFSQNVESALLSFTFPSKVGVFNFRIKEGENFSASIKGPLTNFIFNTNTQTAIVNQVQYLPAQAMHYREYSVGYSISSRMNRFSAGIRAKIYFGKAAFFSGISGSIQHESNNYSLLTKGLVNISIPEVSSTNSDQSISSISIFKGLKTINYLMNSGNPGIGADLGINYRINPDLTLSLSVIDLGRINWKTNVNSKNFDGQYQFQNSDVSGFRNETGNEFITKKINNLTFVDSISESFDLTYNKSTFSRPLPVSVYAGLKIRLNQLMKISIVDRYVAIKDMNYNSLSIAANFDVNKNLSVSSGYSIIGNTNFNIPLAILWKRDFGQIYIGTDNLTAFLVPSISEFAGFSFGTCFYLFKKRNLKSELVENYPFFKHKKIKRNRRNGLIIQEYPSF